MSIGWFIVIALSIGCVQRKPPKRVISRKRDELENLHAIGVDAIYLSQESASSSRVNSPLNCAAQQKASHIDHQMIAIKHYANPTATTSKRDLMPSQRSSIYTISELKGHLRYYLRKSKAWKLLNLPNLCRSAYFYKICAFNFPLQAQKFFSEAR